MQQIPFAFLECTNMLDNPWDPGLYHPQQTRYQPVVNCTHWSVLGSFNNCNNIQLANETTCSEEFDEIHQVVLYGISANMESLLNNGKYSAINAAYTTYMAYYVMSYVSEPFALQYYITIDAQVSKSDELVVELE